MILNKLFTSHMVFAANKPIRVFGTGAGHAVVTLAGERREVISTTDSWMVELPPKPCGGPFSMEVILDNTRTVLEDIYIGEVYLFGGQSNIEFTLKETNTPEHEYQSEDALRFYTADRLGWDLHFSPADGWQVAEQASVGEWSALGYLAGREIARKKGVAVGIVGCYQGGSIIETWMPEGALAQVGIVVPADQKHSDHHCDWAKNWNRDGLLYHHAFLPLTPFSFSGVVWYQGESDTTVAEAEVYDRELCTLIDIWRRDLKSDTLPFVVVQIADLLPYRSEAWPMLQAAQQRVPDMRPAVVMVRSADVCETDNIHPPTKTVLASRIAAALLQL